MVLPLIIVGGLGVGGATGYGMYQAGSRLATPASLKELPAKSFGNLTAGALTAGAAYSLQWRVLNRHLSHLLTYEVPQNVTKWGFRDFLRIAVPLVGPHVVMFSTSVAAMGFVSTKLAVGNTGPKKQVDF